jgi:hypothetical protein
MRDYSRCFTTEEGLFDQVIDTIKRFAMDDILQENNIFPNEHINRFFVSFLHPFNRALILDDVKKSFGFDIPLSPFG